MSYHQPISPYNYEQRHAAFRQIEVATVDTTSIQVIGTVSDTITLFVC